MIDYVPSFTKLAYQYGPFFFAVLITLVSTYIARRSYIKVAARQDPIPSEREKNTHRIIYVVTFSAGMFLVFLSVLWWIFNQPSFYFFRGKVLFLKDYESVTSDSLYFNRNLIDKIDTEAPQMRNENFLIIQNEPFKQDSVFTIFYSKGEGKQEPLDLWYSSESRQEYIIIFDTKSEKTKLRPRKKPEEPPGGSVHSPSIAENTLGPGLLNIEYLIFLNISNEEVNKRLITLLQQERSSVEEKINALIELDELDRTTLLKYVDHFTEKEAMVLTLLDLSRHTDDELAYRANVTLDKINIVEILTNYFISPEEEIRTKAKEIFFRMEKEKADIMLNEISDATQNRAISELKSEIEASQYSLALVPTGTSQGDRYYVRARWDPTNKEIHDCLTKVFNDHLIHNRTLDEEKRLMEGRSSRLVYWYSKAWALFIADKIRECGGKATFLDPWK